MSYEELTLKRDCAALTVPLAERTTLPAGTWVVIMQQLGENFTVQAPELGGYYCIAGKDADALGKSVSTEQEKPAAEGRTIEEAIWDQLRKVYDPEIPVNVVDLGLVYDLSVQPAENGAYRVTAMMTLTAPACPMADVLAADAKRRIESVPGVSEAVVEIVFDPPWNPSMMSEAAKLELGIE